MLPEQSFTDIFRAEKLFWMEQERTNFASHCTRVGVLLREDAAVDSQPGSVQTLNLNILSAIICSDGNPESCDGKRRRTRITQDELINRFILRDGWVDTRLLDIFSLNLVLLYLLDGNPGYIYFMQALRDMLVLSEGQRVHHGGQRPLDASK
jgi:hypothetical protein